MKKFQLFLFVLCATQLPTATDYSDDHNPQKENYQTFHEQMQRCQDLLRAHDEKSPEYPYFDGTYSCNNLCRICQWRSVIQPNGIIFARDLMLPDIQHTANHEKVFLKAIKNGIEFSPELKNVCYESTNEGTDTDDENGYFGDDKNESKEIESNLAYWILAKIYRFKEKDFAERLIKVHKIELVNDQERNKKFYKDSRSADKIVQTLQGYRIVLTSCEEPKVQLYQKSSNIFKTNRKFVADTKYVKEYKIQHPNREEENLNLYKKPSKVLKTNRIFAGEKHYVEEYNVIVSYQKPKVKLYEKSIERKLKDVNSLLRSIDDLKPAEIKIHLKEFGLNLNLKKSQLQKKLTSLLHEKRDLLLNKLQTNDSKAPKCPKCPSAMKSFHDLQQLIEFDARYATGCACDICERTSRENENLFPMNHCVYCDHDECKYCVREGRRKIEQIFEKVDDERFTKNDEKYRMLQQKTGTDVLNRLNDVQQKLKDTTENLLKDMKHVVNKVTTQEEKSKFLSEKRMKLNETLETINKLPKLVDVGIPIELNQCNFGRDVHMMQNGSLLHSPLLLDAEDIITAFEYKNKNYKLTKVLGCGLLFNPIEQSKYETRCGFTYNKIGESSKFIVYGGLPTISICVKIESKWNEKYLSYEKLTKECTKIVWCDREVRKKIYKRMRAGDLESLKYWKK